MPSVAEHNPQFHRLIADDVDKETEKLIDSGSLA